MNMHKHEHKHEECSCHEHKHEHKHEECSCHGHKHEHKHEECSCHEHKHEHKHEECSCHEHKHEHKHEECSCHGHSHGGHSCSCGCEHPHHGSVKVEILKMALSTILIVCGVILSGRVSFALGISLAAVGYFISAYNIIFSAFKRLFGGHFLDENFLMTVASIGAFVLGEYVEALAVLILFKIGIMFEEYAEEKSRRSISALSKLKEENALLIKDGKEISVPIDEVNEGDSVYVYPGGRISFDGIVEQGCSTTDTSAITGESLPREICEGDEVYSGFINLTARIRIRVKRKASDSTVSRILKLVESATERKSHRESFIRKFAKVYTPAVVAAALLLAVVPLFFGVEASVSVYRALSFLVVSCPCALVVSVPLAIFCGIGRGARNGILIKGGVVFEEMKDIDEVMLDKTGTVTSGSFSVFDIEVFDEGYDVLALAASAESYSSHPIALSIVSEAKARGIELFEATEVSEKAGFGVQAKIAGNTVTVGKPSGEYARGDGTAVMVRVDGRVVGLITLKDSIKKGCEQALIEMKKCGVKRITLLTGDFEHAAREVCKSIGADGFMHSLLPEGKAELLTRTQAESGRKIAFAGDGINDAPVLASASVGISIGNLASDAAIEASDIVILNTGKDGCEIGKIPFAIKLSRRVSRIVKINIFGSIAIKLAVLALSAFGLVGIWAAIFADVGVLILAILNSLRA